MTATQQNDNTKIARLRFKLGKSIRCSRTTNSQWIALDPLRLEDEPWPKSVKMHLYIQERKEGVPFLDVRASLMREEYLLSVAVSEGLLADHLLRNLGSDLEIELTVKLGAATGKYAIEVVDFDLEIAPPVQMIDDEEDREPVDTQSDWLAKNL